MGMKASKVAFLCAAVASILLGGCNLIHGGGGDTDGVHPAAGVSAVVIGVERSAMFGNCPGAESGSKRMHKILSAYTKDAVLLQNANATVDKVCDAISRGIENGTDLFILYYAGHGGSQRFADTGDDEVDGKDEFLCLYDNYLLDNDIWELIGESNSRVFLIFDCCHSQTMYRAVPKTKRKALGKKGKVVARGFSMLCWSACADDKESFTATGGGKFTNAIIDAYDKDRTYNEMWKALKADGKLKKHEAIQRTELGLSFGGKKVFK